jgi:hypothetical protein
MKVRITDMDFPFPFTLRRLQEMEAKYVHEDTFIVDKVNKVIMLLLKHGYLEKIK